METYIEGQPNTMERQMNCEDCGIECDYEVILTFGHMEGIDKYTCSSCMVDDYMTGEF